MENEVYKVWSYNLETVLAKKIETILSKLEASSRMKDYKDSKILKDKWTSYSRKNSYARKLEFDETINCLEDFIEILIPVEV